ncbi:diphthine--ammonia ligase [Entomophthora muscae]|uniref:Diphthine--ammonia ligase n=2 Tax=Entomophthora muscae TaxID=34485 RepID=A0ACC2UQR5_9FUNG|nr:diphthine--ammonia ligase [Entomophthora muscae]
MKVVALISGGKDSCFNMMECVKNGHEIVALANLHPPESSDKHEMDSYMYQTVGHDVILSYADCMGLPLFRQAIDGSPLNQDMNYEVTENDETEDLYKLLSRIKEVHPDIEGVSVGAIFSSYQSIRVENICKRLDLTSLAFLWQREQEALLQDMIDSGLEAILIKVAAMGLNSSHLGKSLSEMLPVLKNLNSKYGINVCGEGGSLKV